MNQSEVEENTCNRRQARENPRDQVTLFLSFFLIGWESGANFDSQSQGIMKQNHSKRELLSTQLKTSATRRDYLKAFTCGD